MPSFIETHATIQRLITQNNISAASLSAAVRDVLSLIQQPALTLEACIHELNSRSEATKGAQPSFTLTMLLLGWAGIHKPIATAYLHKLMLHAFVRQRQPKTTPELPSQLLYCAHIIAKQRLQGVPLHSVMARLRKQSEMASGCELIAQVLLQQMDSAEQTAHRRRLRPLPRAFLQAVRDWPENEALLIKVIQVLEQHPVLQQRLRQQATLHTAQRRLLPLKQALLLLGPEASRELILITHFETHLTAPEFPLRAEVLKRRELLTHCFQTLTNETKVSTPCHPDLMSFFWVYDVWFHASATTQTVWQQPTTEHFPDTVAGWLASMKGDSHERALKLLDYWQMPTELADLLTLKNSQCKLQACARLAHVTCSIIIDYAGEVPDVWQRQLDTLLATTHIKPSSFNSLLLQIAHTKQAHCVFQPLPL